MPFTLQRVYRCNSDGSHDLSFDVGNGPDAPVQEFLVLRSGKILAWGPFTDFSGLPARTIVRLHAEWLRRREDGSVPVDAGCKLDTGCATGTAARRMRRSCSCEKPRLRSRIFL